GDAAQERELLERSLALRRELGDRRLIANSVLMLGSADLARGDYARATPLLQEGLSLAKELQDTWSISLALTYLGRVALLSTGDGDEASQLFRQALSIANDRGDKRVVAECLQGIGAAYSMRGEHAQAARFFGAGEALLEAIGATPSASEVAVTDHFVPNCRADLGEAKFQEEWASGYGLPSDDAVALGLSAPVALGN